MAAAPHLFDDPSLASPELALVDADLAAELRAELASGEDFRPRQVARPPYLSLVFDVGAPELAEEALPVEGEPAEVSAAVVDVMPAYVVLPDEKADDDVVEAEVSDVVESFEDPVLPEPHETSEDLPDYIVRSDDPVADVVPDPVVASTDLAADVLVADDGILEVAEGFADPVLPEPAETSEDLPDYIVLADETGADVVPESVVPEYVKRTDEIEAEDEVVAEASAEQAQSSSNYPVLPDLDERSETLEESEAALRRIREQMGTGAPTAKRRSRLRRRFTVASGICAAAALGVYAADVQLGLLHAPGFLAF